MMRTYALQELAAACGVNCDDARPFAGRILTDSRQVGAGDLFVALRGERFDAHDFVAAVADAGAVAAIVEREMPVAGILQWVVPDTVQALGRLAAFNRAGFSGPVIGLTGSAGKTTTKEMIAAILSQRGTPLVTEGNLNNHIGVPLTLLRLSPANDSAVIEMGASALGEIRYLTGLVKPDVALVTTVAPAHVEGFGSLANVAKGKSEIFEGLSSVGTAVVNLDNEWTASWQAQLRQQYRLLTYSVHGNHQQADVFATDVVQVTEGLRFVLHVRDASRTVTLSFLGQHNVGNAVAAATCCHGIGMPIEQIATGLEQARPYKGRLQLRAGVSGSTMIDDSYNANPESMKMAVRALLEMPASRHVLVLGDMAELGECAAAMHAEVGEFARDAGVRILLACGNLSAETVRAFGEGATHFSSREALRDACESLADCNTVFLVKGSRSAGMDRVADALAAAVDGIRGIKTC